MAGLSGPVTAGGPPQVVRLGGWLPATDRRSRPGPHYSPGACGKPGPVHAWGGSAVTRESMLAGLAPLWASAPQAPWPAVGCCRSVAELLPVIPSLSTTFFGCCPPDSMCPLHPV
ncbi:hypothetical protein ARUE_232p00910 (plasmid) [Arthrobacter sp. Rue61a]|nr:hypothetical protein ARUE_232p00910 [Arthrobacter sp. Rue61a]